MRALAWLVRALVFFALFAFALNNREPVDVNWFFGFKWHAPLVIVVLAAFAAGCAIGVLAMVPSWWRQRRVARLATPPTTAQTSTTPSTQVPSSFGAEAALPPREGL
jgi:putative membrane protein